MVNFNKNNSASIGVLMVNTSFTRIPGDIGNPSTFDFPVRYEVIQEATPNKMLSLDDANYLIPLFVKASKKLEREGIKAITTSCGFLALFQNELREEVNIPVFTSSLLQVPMVSRMIGENKYVGIITANSKALNKKHLRAVGIDDNINIEIMGMEDENYFSKIITENPVESLENNEKNIEKEIVEVAKELIYKNSTIGAIVLECTNMPPYSRSIQDSLKLPVFDIVTLTNYIYEALNKKMFGQIK